MLDARCLQVPESHQNIQRYTTLRLTCMDEIFKNIVSTSSRTRVGNSNCLHPADMVSRAANCHQHTLSEYAYLHLNLKISNCKFGEQGVHFQVNGGSILTHRSRNLEHILLMACIKFISKSKQNSNSQLPRKCRVPPDQIKAAQGLQILIFQELFCTIERYVRLYSNFEGIQ